MLHKNKFLMQTCVSQQLGIWWLILKLLAFNSQPHTTRQLVIYTWAPSFILFFEVQHGYYRSLRVRSWETLAKNPSKELVIEERSVLALCKWQHSPPFKENNHSPEAAISSSPTQSLWLNTGHHLENDRRASNFSHCPLTKPQLSFHSVLLSAAFLWRSGKSHS